MKSRGPTGTVFCNNPTVMGQYGPDKVPVSRKAIILMHVTIGLLQITPTTMGSAWPAIRTVSVGAIMVKGLSNCLIELSLHYK
jgi:hypothetical protein